MIYMDIAKQIEDLRKELYIVINQFGINAKETKQIKQKLDSLIQKFYKEQIDSIKCEYYLSYEKLKGFTKEQKQFPNKNKWNKYIKGKCYFATEELEYLSELSWGELEIKIKKEIERNY